MNDVKTRVLVVDENMSDREALSEMLKTMGFWPILCNGPVDAIEYCRMGMDPDVVLVDSGLPEIGLESLEQLLAYRMCEAPIIILATYMGCVETERLLNLGATAVISKAITCSGLHRMIEQILDSPITETVQVDEEFLPMHPDN